MTMQKILNSTDDMPDDYANAYQEGCTDYAQGYYRDQNPYHYGTDAHTQWENGWCDSADEDRIDNEYDDSMDGDAGSALASAGWGTDEDYRCDSFDDYDSGEY